MANLAAFIHAAQRAIGRAGMVGLGLIVLSLAGCGSGLMQVSGTVTVDGEPAEGVVLLFLPIGEENSLPATAVSGADGRFSLMTDMESGVRKGSYRINANWPDPDYKPPKAKGLSWSDPEPAPDLLKGKYMGQSSVVTTEITSSISDLTLELAM